MTTATRPAYRVGLLLGACPALAALAAQPAAAQQPLLSHPLDSGAVVRLHLRDGLREGAKMLVPFAPDSPSFSYCRWPALPCTPGSERHVVRPAREMLGLEIHRGSQWKLGGVIGALVGVPMGYSLISFSEFMGEERLSVVGQFEV